MTPRPRNWQLQTAELALKCQCFNLNNNEQIFEQLKQYFDACDFAIRNWNNVCQLFQHASADAPPHSINKFVYIINYIL